MVKAQEWLDREYPKEKYRKYINERGYRTWEIYLNEPSLEGELDFGGFTYDWLRILISTQVDETKLSFKNKTWFVLIFKCVKAQKWLDENYPSKGTCVRKGGYWTNHKDFGKTRSEITKLDIRHEKLEGHLNLNDFPNLEWIGCSYNKLTDIILPTNLTNLKYLDLKYNNFPDQNINKYGLCFKCCEPNTSKDWCQPCAEKEWQEDLEQPIEIEQQETKEQAGQKIASWFKKKHSKKTPRLVEKFIEKQPTSYGKKMKWIPHEQFTNIKQIGEGGFSKIYKASWKKGKKWYDNDDYVILKSLTNSQNVTLEFLSETINTKLVDSIGNVVECYGISQDPITKNYVIVMDYMNEGNLRQVLQYRHNVFYLIGGELLLSLASKLQKLRDIAKGLNSIHQQNLVHRDFHSGNILNNKSGVLWDVRISDLGLSHPTNCQPQEGQIFGVLPYVAPELLRNQPYTQKSDIYSFGIIAYELFANAYPYPKVDDLELSLKVCQGYRPNIDKVSIPQLLKDLIKRCWNADPQKRPSAKELREIISDWLEWNSWKSMIEIKKKTPFYHQYKVLKNEYHAFSQNTPYRIHPNATLTSKMIDTKEITERLRTILQEKVEDQELDELDINDFNLDGLNIQEDNQDENWTNINSNFTSELTQQWQSLNFTYQQTQEWINIGLQPTDFNFCAWLRDIKQFTPEQSLSSFDKEGKQVLNYSNLEQLNQEFSTWWQECNPVALQSKDREQQLQSQIEQPPK